MRLVTAVKLSLGVSLALGVAAAGAMLYANDASALRREATSNPTHMHMIEPTPEMISAWRSKARTTDYISPRVPI